MTTFFCKHNGNRRFYAGRIAHYVRRTIALLALTLAIAGNDFSAVGATPLLTVDEPTVFLIPEKFIGRVIVFYDVPDAPPPRFEDGARVLEVPASGLVATRLRRGSNRAATFYFVDKAGHRKLINWEKSVHDRATAPDADQVLIRGGSVGGLIIEGHGISGEECIQDSLGFFVGTVNDAEKKRDFQVEQAEVQAEDEFGKQHLPRCARPTTPPSTTPTH